MRKFKWCLENIEYFLIYFILFIIIKFCCIRVIIDNKYVNEWVRFCFNEILFIKLGGR